MDLSFINEIEILFCYDFEEAFWTPENLIMPIDLPKTVTVFALALAVLPMPATAAPFWTVQTVTGTVTSAACKSYLKRKGIISHYRLAIDVRSNAGVQQHYAIDADRICYGQQISRNGQGLAAVVSRNAAITVEVRSSAHPDQCAVDGEKGDLVTIYRNRQACSYTTGIKSITVDGRRIY